MPDNILFMALMWRLILFSRQTRMSNNIHCMALMRRLMLSLDKQGCRITSDKAGVLLAVIPKRQLVGKEKSHKPACGLRDSVINSGFEEF